MVDYQKKYLKYKKKYLEIKKMYGGVWIGNKKYLNPLSPYFILDSSDEDAENVFDFAKDSVTKYIKTLPNETSIESVYEYIVVGLFIYINKEKIREKYFWTMGTDIWTFKLFIEKLSEMDFDILFNNEKFKEQFKNVLQKW